MQYATFKFWTSPPEGFSFALYLVGERAVDVEKSSLKTNRKPIRRQSLHDEVVTTLREMIVTGELQPGQRIVEQDLSAQLGVSRTPIREAIKTLTLDGLVESPAHRGAMVKPLAADEIEALFDVISVLEALAAECAARRMEPREMKKLETLHERMKQAYDDGNRTRYFDLNSDIHDFLVEHSGNPILIETHARLMLRARRGRFLAIASHDRWAEALQQHEDLMTALRARDAETAARIWRAHLQMTGETLLATLQKTAEAKTEQSPPGS